MAGHDHGMMADLLVELTTMSFKEENVPCKTFYRNFVSGMKVQKLYIWTEGTETLYLE